MPENETARALARSRTDRRRTSPGLAAVAAWGRFLPPLEPPRPACLPPAGLPIAIQTDAAAAAAALRF